MVIDFIHELNWDDLPLPVQNQARRCLLDTIGAAIGGNNTELSQIIRDYAANNHGGTGAFIWFDGREVSPPGAALANGMTIDSLDIHDGYSLVKGHAGAAVVPAVLASIHAAKKTSGTNLLTALVVGYEIALRAGVALHQTACDYHTSGAWNALGCAAVTARNIGLTGNQTRHALGIAEYHGPRSQMMRCIEFPTMVKDGSGWGAMAGVSAGMLAASGFTGAPAITIEAPEIVSIWGDLGQRWRILEQYFKPYAVCRWAQPAIAAVLKLKQSFLIPIHDITSIKIFSFYEAVQLDCASPKSTEEAQYSLPFPVAAAYINDQVGGRELSGVRLEDPTVLGLSNLVTMQEEPEYSCRFPGERIARAVIETRHGRRYDSGEVQPKWEAENPPSDDSLKKKFRALACYAISNENEMEDMENLIWNYDRTTDGLTLVRKLVKMKFEH